MLCYVTISKKYLIMLKLYTDQKIRPNVTGDEKALLDENTLKESNTLLQTDDRFLKSREFIQEHYDEKNRP